MSELESVIRRLEEMNHRITSSRVAVIAAVLAHSGHFSVGDIVRQARAVARSPSPSGAGGWGSRGDGIDLPGRRGRGGYCGAFLGALRLSFGGAHARLR